MKFIDIPNEDQKRLLLDMQARIGLNAAIIEKDWWITSVLRAIFSLPYADSLSFKGGTSLSKCWHIIERMSEDIDIGITREYLGFTGSLSKTQISYKLRRAACSFVRDKMQYDISAKLADDGINPELFNVRVDITPVSTTDPEVIWINYKPIVRPLAYIPPVVKIEVSGRSMSEPIAEVEIESLIDRIAPGAVFHEPPFIVRAVLAKRTFLEKLFLLHEEFCKGEGNIRIERMSRHLYDIHKMLNSPIATEALNDNELYDTVITHRRTFIGLRGFDYSTLSKRTLNVVPPESVYNEWRKDYETMQDEMIYGESVSFDNLVADILKLNERINSMN